MLTTMHFTIEADFMTNQFISFMKEGEFHLASELLYGMEGHHKILFFNGCGEFQDDPESNDLLLNFIQQRDNWNEIVKTGLKTLNSKLKREELDYDGIDLNKDYKDIVAIQKYFNKKELTEILLNIENITFIKNNEQINSAIILEDGRVINLGYDEHKYYVPVLYRLKLASDPDVYKDKKNVYISSNQLKFDSFRDGKFVRQRKLRSTNPFTEGQLISLTKYKKDLSEYNGDTIMKIIFDESDTSKGQKIKSLDFIKEHYPWIRVPKYSFSAIPNVQNCIRTSLAKSMPGLIDSVFDVKEDSIEKIFKQWEELNIDNELSVFYQEFLKGPNGVAMAHKGFDFEYSCSENQSEVVNGGKGDYLLNERLENELKVIVKNLSRDLGCLIQVEFVVHNDSLYILEFKIIENNAASLYRSTDFPYEKRTKSVKVTPFTVGNVVIDDLDEVLVVEDDCEDITLVKGKKAILVRNNNRFSHVLAYSSFANIPSAIIGQTELPTKFELDVSGEAYILDLTT